MIIKEGLMVITMPLKVYVGGNFRGGGLSGHDHERDMMTKILKDLDKALKDVDKEYHLFIDVKAKHKEHEAPMDALLISKEGAIILELKKLNGDFKIDINDRGRNIEDVWIDMKTNIPAHYKDESEKMITPIHQVSWYRKTFKNLILKFLEKEGNLLEKEKIGLSNYVSAYIVLPTTIRYELKEDSKKWLEKNLWLKIMSIEEVPEKVIQKLSGEGNPITKEMNERFEEFLGFLKNNLKSPRGKELTEISSEDISYWPKYGDGESRKSIEVKVEFSVIDAAFRGGDDELVDAINVINYLNIQEKYLDKIKNMLKSDRGYEVRVLALDTLLRNKPEDEKKKYLMRLLDDPDTHFFREIVEKLTYLLPDDVVFRRFASILDKIDVNRLNILLNVIEKYPSKEFLNPLVKLYENLPRPPILWPHFPECGMQDDQNYMILKYQILKSIGRIHTEKCFKFLSEKILSKESLEYEPINRAILEGIEKILKNIPVSENEKNKLIENFYKLLKKYNPKYGYTFELLGIVSFEKREPDTERLNKYKLSLKIIHILPLIGTENAFDMALKMCKKYESFEYELISNLSKFDISLDRLIEFFDFVDSYEKMDVAIEIAKRDMEKGWELFNSLEDYEKLRLSFIKNLILDRVPGHREFLIDKIEFDRVSNYTGKKEWKEMICEFSSSANDLPKEAYDEIMSFLYEIILKKGWKQGEDVSFDDFYCNSFINWIGNHAQNEDFDLLWDLFLSTNRIRIVDGRYEENKIKYATHPLIEAMIKINYKEFKKRIDTEIKNEIENEKNNYDSRRPKERFLEVGIFKGIAEEKLIMEIINKSWKEPSEKLYSFLYVLTRYIENIDEEFYNGQRQHFYEILDDIQNKDVEKYYPLADLLFSMIVRFEREDGIEKIVKYRDKFFIEVVRAISIAPYLKTVEYVFQFARENREFRDSTSILGFLKTLGTLKENNVGLLFAKKNSIEFPEKFMYFLNGKYDRKNEDFSLDMDAITLFYFWGKEVLDVLLETDWNSNNTYRRFFTIKYIFDLSKENEELCKEIMDKKDKYRKKLYEIGKILCKKDKGFMWAVEEMLKFLDNGCGETVN